MPKVKQDQNKYTSAETWQSRQKRAESDQEQMFQKFNEWYKMMYAIRDDRNAAPWRSKIHIPILSTKAWNLISKFAQQEPGFEVKVRNDDAEDLDVEQLENVAEKVQRKLEYDYHNPELEQPVRFKIHDCLVDAVVAGTGLAKVPYVRKKKDQYSHMIKGKYDYEKDRRDTLLVGYNDIEPVNIFNVFVAPSATSLQQSPWVIIKEFKSLADLKKTNESFGVEIYKNLSALEGVKADSDPQAELKKARQNLTSDQDPISADQTVDLIPIFECYERATNTICTYAAKSNDKGGSQRWLKIREQQNPYWHGKYPLVAFYVRRRPFSFWGESIFETTDRLQAAADDIFNHYMDNWNLSIDGMIMIDETSQVADYLVEPGGELVYSGEQPKQFRFPEPNPNQLTLVMNEIQKAIEQATISNYATGTPVSGLDKTQGTARGTLAILEAATDMIQFMRDNFTTAIKQIGEMWLSNNRQFVNFDFEVPVLKDNKMTEEILTPEELQLQMELRIDDMSMQPISDMQRKENFLAYMQQLVQAQTASINQAQLAQDNSQVLFIDWHTIAQDLAKHFHVRSLQKQIMPNEQALAAQQEAQQAEAQAAEAAQVQQTEAINEEDANLAEVADLPDEDRIQAAEDALAELEAVSSASR